MLDSIYFSLLSCYQLVVDEIELCSFANFTSICWSENKTSVAVVYERWWQQPEGFAMCRVLDNSA
jgi:hypothetical protein